MNKFTDCHLHIHDSDREAAMRFLDVVAECGFKNYKSLINYFREATDMTPSKYSTSGGNRET